MTPTNMIPTVIKVYLSSEDSSIVEVPITPNTTAEDVVEFCKEPGEKECRLLERWRGNNRVVDDSEKPFNLLTQWGSHAPEINFILYRSLSDKAQDADIRQSLDDSAFPAIPGLNLENANSLTKLREIALEQQKKIKEQEDVVTGKKNRLKFVKDQLKHHQMMQNDNEKLRRLKEKAEAQEAKLKKIRMLCGKAESNRQKNIGVGSELKAVQQLFDQKHSELASAMQKVDELRNQLDELRRGNMTPNLINGKSISFDTTVASSDNGVKNELDSSGGGNEIESMRREMGILGRVNDEKRKQLEEQRGVLRKNGEKASELDRQIEVLTARLRQKKLTNAGYQRNNIGGNNNAAAAAFVKLATGGTGTTGQPGSQQSGLHTIVAAVEPLIKSNNQQQKPAGSYDVIPPPMKHINNENEIAGRIDQLPPMQHQPEADVKTKQQGTDMNKHNKTSMNDALTAKVQPMPQQQQPPYKFLPPTNSSTSNPPNIYAYKDQPPAAGNVVVLPSGNIQYNAPPPPYHNDPSSVDPALSELRKKYSNAPRPLKKRSSITEAERPQGPNIPKFLYDKLYKQADTPYYRNNMASDKMSVPPPAYKEPASATPAISKVQKPSAVPADGGVVSYESNITPREFIKQLSSSGGKNSATTELVAPIPSSSAAPYSPPDNLSKSVEQQIPTSASTGKDETDSNLRSFSSPAQSSPITTPTTDDDHITVACADTVVVPTKSILKKERSKGPRRNIRFDPLALLLDASLEGDFELVQEVISEVENPSGANDEGISALHNAVCAGHFDLVRFLVHYGCDINAADTDGWTPLHCAASCNNFQMSKFLVENGSCIFATTLSDGETAPAKCEKQEEGFAACYNYLRGVQDKLGHVRQGQVYALFDYQAEYEDELSFSDGDLLTVIKKGDENEHSWWWARTNGGQVGYIPQNLVGLWPRIKPVDVKSEK